MKKSPSKKNRETLIIFDELNPNIYVSTYNTSLKHRLKDYSERHPDLCQQIDQDDGKLCFEILKGRFGFRLTEPYSDERRLAAKECAQKQNNLKLNPRLYY